MNMTKLSVLKNRLSGILSVGYPNISISNKFKSIESLNAFIFYLQPINTNQIFSTLNYSRKKSILHLFSI